MQKQRKSTKRSSKPSSRAPHRGIQPVPSAYRTQMAYANVRNVVEAAAGAGAFQTFALTNLFDPDYTGVGFQPVSFDQWSQMYNRFRVMGVKVVMELCSNINVPMQVGYVLSTGPTLPAAPDSWAVQRYADSRMLSYNTGGNAVTRFTFDVKPWVILSLTKQQYLDDMDFSHSATAGPSRTMYLHMFCVGYSAGIGNLMGQVKFTYDVELSEPVGLTVS